MLRRSLALRPFSITTTASSHLHGITQRLSTKVGTADPKIHAEDPQDEDAEEAVKRLEAEELQQEKLIRQGGKQPTESPSAVTGGEAKKKPFSSSMKLESSELGEQPDPSFQQKRRVSLLKQK